MIRLNSKLHHSPTLPSDSYIVRLRRPSTTLRSAIRNCARSALRLNLLPLTLYAFGVLPPHFTFAAAIPYATVIIRLRRSNARSAITCQWLHPSVRNANRGGGVGAFKSLTIIPFCIMLSTAVPRTPEHNCRHLHYTPSASVYHSSIGYQKLHTFRFTTLPSATYF